MYEFFTGEEPVTTDILPQLTSQVVLAGRALYFPENIPAQDATVEIWEVNGDTGARIGSSPQATYYLPPGGNGTWGPFNAKGGAYYEIAFTYYATYLGMMITIHYYYEPFIRNDYWIRLLCDPPSGGVGSYMDKSKSSTHSDLIIIRYKEFWGDQGVNNDILEINGINIVNAATCPMNKMGAANAIYAFDEGNDSLSHIYKPVTYYYAEPFMSGVDLYIPAAIPPNGTISIVLTPRGGGGKTQVINVPNWASTNNTIIVQFHDYLQVDWWPMFRHDLSHTGYSTSTAPNTNNTIWNYTTGNSVDSSPAVADGKVYVGSNDHKVYCLNASTGASMWNYTTGVLVDSSPAVADGKVYVGSNDWKVYCLNASTGASMWNYTTGGPVDSSPAVAGGVVYVGSNDSYVYALNASKGTLKWSYKTGDNNVWSSPAVADGFVYVSSVYVNHKVYALNASTGASVWNYTTGGPVDSSPAVAGGVVYVGSHDDNVYALNATTGALVWSYTTGGVVYSSPAVADGKVYVGSYDNKVYCLDALTGAQIWNYTTGGNVASSPAVADGKVYVGSNDWKVYCLNASTGTPIWNYTTGGNVASSPAVADGKVYIGSDDNKVYAFGPRVHDVAATNVTSSKTFGWQGFSTSINVTVANPGNFNETFKVTVYANATSIATHIVTLTSGKSTTITFTWNTTRVPCGKYTISAYAAIVPSETNLANNYFTGGSVDVRLWGDVNGAGTVTLADVGKLDLIFSEVYPYTCPPYDVKHPETYYYLPNPATGKVEHLMPDINGNGMVTLADVGLLDLIFSGYPPPPP
jgi:outer membrane protein assembly factor BamB